MMNWWDGIADNEERERIKAQIVCRMENAGSGAELTGLHEKTADRLCRLFAASYETSCATGLWDYVLNILISSYGPCDHQNP